VKTNGHHQRDPEDTGTTIGLDHPANGQGRTKPDRPARRHLGTSASHPNRRDAAAAGDPADADRESENQQYESAVNLQGLSKVVEALQGVTSADAAARAALDAIRETWNWDHGSFWKVDPAENVIRCALDCGSVHEEFRRAMLEGVIREGEGVAGRAWKTRDLVYVPDLGQVQDSCAAVAARRGAPGSSPASAYRSSPRARSSA
jgi:hypothetical protein